ncbi:MAG: SusC/RagA family TonB-linked outer membrane protein [Bacteroidetes bacterium]|nr:SusC/RagA family TonB-linked outer membrane protein [Bacteroidota bacterium]
MKKTLKLCMIVCLLFAHYLIANAQEMTITGTVTESSGSSLPGVNIVIKGTSTGTITNVDGNYSITVPDENSILVFSFVGYLSKEVTVGNQTTLNITLATDVFGLDEIVVIGYGTQRKINVTGSVVTVQSEELLKAPVTNASDLLIGRAPGLITKQDGGTPGDDAATLSIRGFDSPLVLVDGVEMSFNRLDPNDIESISILKDAAAAIYGARAGNGVILVTTKRGSIGKPTIEYHGNVSFQQPTVIPSTVTSWEYAELYREGELNYGLEPTYTEEDIEKFRQGGDPNYPNSDWYDALYTDWTPMQQHNLSVRGGMDKIRYFVSVGLQDQESIFESGDWNFSRYNARANIDADITDNLSVGFDLSYRVELRDQPTTDLNASLNDLRTAQPIWPTTLPDPSLGGAYSGFSQRSPVASTTKDYSGFRDDQRQYFRGKISLQYKIPYVDGLIAKAGFNYYTYNTNRKTQNKPFDVFRYDYDTEEYTLTGTNGANTLNEEFTKYQQLYPLVSLEYDKTFGDHSVKGLLLGEWIDTDSLIVTADRKDLLSMDIPYLFAGSSENILNNGSANETGRASYVGRLNYHYQGKYLLEGTFRYDASHKFPEDSRWGFFPSVSAGWRISEESFMQGFGWLDNLKLRISYSQSGDDNVAAFKFLTGYTIREGTSEVYLIGDQVGRIINTTGLPNPDITWLDMTTYNVGMDASFMKGLIGFELDLFYRETTNIFGIPTETYPSTFGATLPQLNLNTTDDRGFELLVRHRNKVGDFNYTVSANVGLAREKYVDWSEEPYDDPDEIRIFQRTGNWTNRWIGYVSDGIFESQAEIDAHPVDQDQNGNTTLIPGDIIYKDLDGNDTINWRDQDVIGYGAFPDLTYGMDINVSYKGLSVSALFQGASLFNMNMTGAARVGFSNGSIPLDYHYDYRWKPDPNDPATNINPDAQLPATNDQVGANANNNKTSDFWLVDNTYLRLKNLNISYNLPQNWIRNIGVQGIRVYVAGTNLLTLSKLGIYKGSFDPEGPTNNATRVYPQLKTITLGVNVTL